MAIAEVLGKKRKLAKSLFEKASMLRGEPVESAVVGPKVVFTTDEVRTQKRLPFKRERSEVSDKVCLVIYSCPEEYRDKYHPGSIVQNEIEIRSETPDKGIEVSLALTESNNGKFSFSCKTRGGCYVWQPVRKRHLELFDRLLDSAIDSLS